MLNAKITILAKIASARMLVTTTSSTTTHNTQQLSFPNSIVPYSLPRYNLNMENDIGIIDILPYTTQLEFTFF